ncbi:MAG: protein kinase [Ignavibacteria bacterium]|nr:protein kinase [Ignavibacteria bacterium]
MIGQTISHYWILERLGGGGMGVVYKAEDTKLKRTVALKFLPPELTLDAEAKERFIHEAQAASALDHNNICTIHEIGETDDGQMFIAMACYEGETLKKKIERGPLKIEEASDLAIQIALGLSEAHAHGIVHRDVKPANILITKSGVAKIVDFGLAKLSGRTKLTKAGSTLGTVAYMSPEQLQGSDIDARADIFSFGVVLYEMLTGKTPFRGDHEAALMYSIVSEEPEPLQHYIADVPSELIHILSRALEKSPADRYKTMDDLLIDLRRLRKETSKVSMPAFRHIAQRGFTWKHAAFIGLSVIIIGALAIVFILPSLRKTPQLNPDMRLSTLHIPVRNVGATSVSRDGNWMAFSARDDHGKANVYMMNVSEGRLRPVTNDSAARIFSVAISPDQSTILYARRLQQEGGTYPCEVVSVPFLGGRSKVIIEEAQSAGWFPDGSRIYFSKFSSVGSSRLTIELWTAKPDGSDRRFEYADTVDQRGNFRFSWDLSPDLKSFAWTRNHSEGYTEIIIREFETGHERQLTFDKKIADDVAWTKNDHIIFSSNRRGNVNLWIVPSSGGEPEQLTRGSGADFLVWVSADCRRMIYAEAQSLGHIKLGDLVDGTVRQLTVDERSRSQPSISSSGAYIAFVAREESEYSARSDIYVVDRQGGEIRRLTDGPESKYTPSWSPDEIWIAYNVSNPAEPPDSNRVYLIKVDNPSQPRLIGKGSAVYWFNDREFIVWRSMKSYRGSVDRSDLVEFGEDSVRIIPILDGKYLAANDFRSSRRGAWITTAQSYQSFGLKDARQLVKGIELQPEFARDGRDWFYTEPGGKGYLHRISLPDGKDERVGRLFEGLGGDFSVRRDGKEIAYSVQSRKTRYVIIDSLFN